MLHGKRRAMGLGPYPEITLGEARDLAIDARRLTAKGIDPIEASRKVKAEARAAAAKSMTFMACAEAYIKAKASEWKNEKHQQQWTNTLKAYAEPVFKNTPVSEIGSELVLKVLEPIWTTKTETASRVRQRIENILDWAKVKGYRAGENPAQWRGHLKHQLAAPGKVKDVEHFSVGNEVLHERTKGRRRDRRPGAVLHDSHRRPLRNDAGRHLGRNRF
jgi:hypothetical protein